MNQEPKTNCGVCKIPNFERNNYFYGKMMVARDFFAEQCYFNEKRWLINRMVLGWGVVCGLEVLPGDTPGEVVVTPGLAIDCCGREILVCCQQTIPLRPEQSACHPEEPTAEGPKTVYIVLEYQECKTEPVHLPAVACDAPERGEFNRILDSFKIRVKTAGEIAPPDPCLRRCPLVEPQGKTASLHSYLCQELKTCPVCPTPASLILAQVTIPAPAGQSPSEIQIDQCSQRRLVYGNQVLYDLFRCFHGDLPRVTRINWQNHGATLSWEEFASKKDGIYQKGIRIGFDRPMDDTTINTETFLVMVKMQDGETGNFKYPRIPGRVTYDAVKNEACFTIESKWLDDVYLGYSSIKKKAEFVVVLKGDFIMSKGDACNPPRALDGNFIGGRLPSGNGTPGGDFISWFKVVKPTSPQGQTAQVEAAQD